MLGSFYAHVHSRDETRRDERLEEAYITSDVCVCCRIGGRGLRVGGTNNGRFIVGWYVDVDMLVWFGLG